MAVSAKQRHQRRQKKRRTVRVFVVLNSLRANNAAGFLRVVLGTSVAPLLVALYFNIILGVVARVN
jgi:hypothetical protein